MFLDALERRDRELFRTSKIFKIRSLTGENDSSKVGNVAAAGGNVDIYYGFPI